MNNTAARWWPEWPIVAKIFPKSNTPLARYVGLSMGVYGTPSNAKNPHYIGLLYDNPRTLKPCRSFRIGVSSRYTNVTNWQITRINSRLDRTAPAAGGGGMGRLGGKKPRTDIWARTDKQTNGHAWMGPNLPGECKMWCSDEIISFWTRHVLTHTRTHNAKPIHPRYAACNQQPNL